MSKIKQGHAHTAGNETTHVHLENANERGSFQIHVGGTVYEPSQARQLAEVLNRAADTAEILDAAVQQ